MPRIPVVADALGLAVRKDVRNHLVREVDRVRHRQMWEIAAVVAMVLVLVLASVWQRTQLRDYGYAIEALLQEQAAEEASGRLLQLDIETLRAHSRIEDLAKRRVGMTVPAREDVVVLERVTQGATAPRSLVASK
jgi:cell division protein FtsL